MDYYCDYIESILFSFASTWWLLENKWFVSFNSDTSSLMTIPYFAPIERNKLDSFPFRSTAFDSSWFYSNVTRIDLNLYLQWPSFEKHYRYITTISLGEKINVDCIKNLRTYVDFKHVRHLKIGTNYSFHNSHSCSKLLLVLL